MQTLGNFVHRFKTKRNTGWSAYSHVQLIRQQWFVFPFCAPLMMLGRKIHVLLCKVYRISSSCMDMEIWQRKRVSKIWVSNSNKAFLNQHMEMTGQMMTVMASDKDCWLGWTHDVWLGPASHHMLRHFFIHATYNTGPSMKIKSFYDPKPLNSAVHMVEYEHGISEWLFPPDSSWTWGPGGHISRPTESSHASISDCPQLG